MPCKECDMTKAQTVVEKSPKKIELLFDLHPVDLNEPREATAMMRQSLATMYGDNGFRAFLENAVKYANKSLISAASMEQVIFYRSRIETLMQLLNMGKQHFIHFEMLRAKKEPLREVEHQVAEVKL